MSFNKLFSPITIRGLTLKNRVVMSAMGTKLCGSEGIPHAVTQKMIDFHVARAKGGVGLNFVEVTSVHGPSTTKLELDLSEDKYIAPLKKLTDAVHAVGGKVGIQLYQASVSACIDPDAELIIGDLMTNEEIINMIECFRTAAKRAVDAGVDVIELHCAHNYLCHVFLSAGLNHRQDEWGGCLENRMRFPLACIDAIRSQMPDSMPLFIRVDCHDDFLDNGLSVDDIITFCKEAKLHGVDVANISRGNISGMATMYEVPPVDLPNGLNVEDAARIRKETGLIVMPCGRINTPELAEKILSEDKADMIVMARANLADPEFCNKAKAGKTNQIKYCIGCNQGCYDYYVNEEKEHISCLRNPFVGEESNLSLTKTSTPKKVLIIGGGIGGIEAADALYERGHKPIIIEASNKLGGQLLLAGVSPRKYDTLLAPVMGEKNIREKNIEIHLNTIATAETIKQEKPDAVIIAIGAQPIIPNIQGATGSNVISSHQVLSGEITPSGNVVIIGGGMVGIEVAEYLDEKGSCVSVIEQQNSFANDMGDLRKLVTTLALKETNIKIHLNSKCVSIEQSKVIIECKNETKEIPCDTVVMAVGSKSRESSNLQDACRSMDIPFYIIGDAKEPRRALNAIHEAILSAIEI